VRPIERGKGDSVRVGRESEGDEKRKKRQDYREQLERW
jgi:hypothetical protein